MAIRVDEERCRAAFFSVKRHHALEVDAEKRIGIDEGKRVARQEWRQIGERARRAERFVRAFLDVADADAEATSVAKIILDDVSEVADDEDDVREAVRPEFLHLPREERLPRDLYHRLRDDVFRDAGEARATASRLDYGLHAFTIQRAARRTASSDVCLACQPVA